MLLDTHYQVETPEGIDLYAHLAGPAPRIIAYLIDVMIRGVILFALYMILPTSGRAGMGILFILVFLLEWFYPVFFEIYSNGQTPGKKAVQLEVVNDNLTPINWNASIIRNLLRAVDFFPFAYCLGITSMVLNQNFQRLGDIAAGTLVIHREQKMDHVSLPNVLPCPPPVALSVEEQLAVIGFAQRHEQLTPSRQRELAAIVQDVMRSDREHAVAHLQGVGCWLLRGQR